MKKETIQPYQTIAGQKALEFIKKNRKKFYRGWYKRYADHKVMSGSDLYKHSYRHNPRRIAFLNQIMGSLTAMGYFKIYTDGFGHRDAQQVYDAHYGKFHQLRVFPMNKKKGGYFPHMDKTKAIIEFIARGFVHADNYKIDYIKKCHIKCHIAPLVWPEQFDSQRDALIVLDKIAIPGYTGVELAKELK